MSGGAPQQLLAVICSGIALMHTTHKTGTLKTALLKHCNTCHNAHCRACSPTIINHHTLCMTGVHREALIELREEP